MKYDHQFAQRAHLTVNNPHKLRRPALSGQDRRIKTCSNLASSLLSNAHTITRSAPRYNLCMPIQHWIRIKLWQLLWWRM